MDDTTKTFILSLIKDLVIPEIPKIVEAPQARGDVVTEATIWAELQARGILQTAQVDAWFAAHTVKADPVNGVGGLIRLAP